MGIPEGRDDFKELRDKEFYYVDKSELISDILKNEGKVFLFTRPRRFGKSTNLSMLDAFFNIRYKGNNWFDGLKINDHPEAEKHCSAYPVINLDMKDLSVKNYDLFLSKVRTMISTLYADFVYLKDSEKVTERIRMLYFQEDPFFFDEARVRESVKMLCRMIYEHHGIKPIVLIDEYDSSLNNAYNTEPYDEVLEFLKDFYSSILKGNDYFEFAVLTGVMQIAKEGIFSGLNNLRVNNIFSTDFDERFGFTESEVKELCTYYGHPEKFEEAKEWYDGYRFGDAEIYNPWSVLSYVKYSFNAEPYWAGTSGNDIITTLLEYSTEDTFKDLAALGNGDTVSKVLPNTIVMDDLKTDRDAIFSIFATAGYINAVPTYEGSYLLSIPNKEMYKVFYKHIMNFAPKGIDYYSTLLNAAEKCDIAGIESVMYDFFSKNIPFFVLENEMDYEEILTGLIMSRDGKYRVTMEHETGNGRHDLILTRRLAKYPNIVMEFKKAKSGNEAESERLAHEAIEQIHQCDYCKELKGTTYLYGVCFNGKKPKAILEKMTF